MLQVNFKRQPLSRAESGYLLENPCYYSKGKGVGVKYTETKYDAGLGKPPPIPGECVTSKSLLA